MCVKSFAVNEQPTSTLRFTKHRHFWTNSPSHTFLGLKSWIVPKFFQPTAPSGRHRPWRCTVIHPWNLLKDSWKIKISCWLLGCQTAELPAPSLPNHAVAHSLAVAPAQGLGGRTRKSSQINQIWRIYDDILGKSPNIRPIYEWLWVTASWCRKSPGWALAPKNQMLWLLRTSLVKCVGLFKFLADLFYSILFYSILFYSILFYSILFYLSFYLSIYLSHLILISIRLNMASNTFYPIYLLAFDYSWSLLRSFAILMRFGGSSFSAVPLKPNKYKNLRIFFQRAGQHSW